QLRIDAAKEITDRLCDHSPILVEQAHMVSHELIRVAILWHELWHEYLEEASRLYFTEKKPEAMIEHLEILHRKLDQGPETTREESFVQVHGKDLREAREACHRYLRHREAGEMDKASADMDKAWDIYYGVFRRIEKQLPLLTTIDLQYVSPNLLRAEDLELAVPGTYKGGKSIVRIARFVPKLSVIASKQRPRRLAINGNDGKEYQYCLKGHEDLRQDERVMQVFSLVNTLLSADRQSFKRKLHIQGYAAIPLAPNVGVLRWVQHADTLHVLVSDYRQARKIHLQIEYRLMLQMAPDYVNLTMLQKLEVFKYALDNTTGQDLYRVLWLTSGDSESWLERRSTYTRSLAVSSMVGHILGLGDRHPANLLLDQYTGKVVHIDFGDCFEIAMHREKFPERVPFRLTRMLVSAMEVSGIDGSFKVTSEITMKVLRDNREPLMAVLEAFIYDPLVSWRLTTETDTRTRVQNAPVVTGGANPPAPGAGVDGDQFGAAAAAAYTRYAGGPRRRVQLNEGLAFNEDMTEWRNAKALEVYQRVQKKLTGRDFNPDEELTVEEQVAKLIKQATALENLCQAFPGWCPFW
ncbi:phosphatidylinositol kinase- protein kinase tor1, partial [Serendipita sp. 400]